MNAVFRRGEIPQHVPAERIVEFDVYNVDMQDTEFQIGCKVLHAQGTPDLVWTPCNGGHWMPIRADVMDEIIKDPARFSSRKISVPVERNPDPPMVPVQVDPPLAQKYRALIMPFLSPKAVNSLGEQARALAIQLIEGFQPRGECEFVSEFAHHLPIYIFMRIVDLPESDRVLLTQYSEEFVRPKVPADREKAWADFSAYTRQKIAERRGGDGDDMITVLTRGKVDGEPLDERTLVGMINLVMQAGLDTVASMLGFFARFLAINVEHRQQLIDEPGLITNAVEEMLRRFPIATLGREVAVDTQVNGVLLKAGDMIAFPTALYGMDERRFPEPLTVDFKRKVPMHQTFGDGVHRCMGSMLARTELKIFLEEWFKRIPDYRLMPGGLTQIAVGSVATMDRLDLVWDVK